MTCWLLNSTVIPISRIGHPETANHIRDLSGITISREESPMQTDDQTLVVRLAYRLANADKRRRPTPSAEDFVYGFLKRIA